jgi:bifunctional ADP-heptose synthase (sugar kinase/adenylyltransferase)
VPALVSHAVDELGCGDALLAAVTLARLGGATLTTAAILGQVAAAAESQRLGNVAIAASDLRHGLRRLLAAHLTVTREAETSSRDQLHPAHV